MFTWSLLAAVLLGASQCYRPVIVVHGLFDSPGDMLILKDFINQELQMLHFGFYNENETVLEMKKQLVYRQDTFGLKTMDARKAITTFTMKNVHHTDWHSNKTVFEECIVKWLT
ncbi:lysosomal thioesterase PPT2-A-like [Rhinoraja longicauda]